MSREAIRELSARFLFGSGAYRPLIRRRAYVLVFHRVDSRIGPGPLTCTEEQFTAYCEFLTTYFEVISLSELLTRLETGARLDGEVVITFDDGYRDNWETAAPILRAVGAPATFFIATGYIGTTRVAPWDRRLRHRAAWMTWDHVAALAEGGFEIGAHTRDHVDLGGISGPLAERQIRGSAEDIKDHLGERPSLFCFPFGRPVNITEANRDIVRRAGFRCCLSAFGGTVREDTSTYRIPRVPVSNWYQSPEHLGAELLRESLRPLPGRA